jgi:glycosyltransferase involved in cell wall biosynthesis
MKFVSVLTSDARGGAEFGAASMLEALIAQGHEVMLLSDQPEIARELGVPSQPVELGAKLSTRSFWRLAATWPQELRRLRTALKAQMPYDVLIVHYKKEQLLASMLPAALRPVLLWAEWGPIPFPMRKGLARQAYLAAARRAAAVMAVSAGTRDSVCDVGVPADKVVVVPNAVRPDEIGFRPEGRKSVRAELGIPDDALVVGCISRLHPKKRNDVVVEAVGMLNGRTHLIMAGGGETEAALREQAQGLGDRAHFIPTPGDDTIAAVLSAFDVSVFCPSPTEGAPRAVILGMLAERPCIATGAEGVADMIDVSIGGITVPENDPLALAELVRSSLEDARLAARQGATARRLAVERYGPGAVAGQIESLVNGAQRLSHS